MLNCPGEVAFNLLYGWLGGGAVRFKDCCKVASRLP